MMTMVEGDPGRVLKFQISVKFQINVKSGIISITKYTRSSHNANSLSANLFN